tara:strand:+ start:1176 stop:1460 length:285 start_codon:yes stop_codon:yes gene_type:complete
MASTKDVKKTEGGRLSYRGETFSGFNKPKRTPDANKKFAVLARQGDQVKLVRFGDPDMRIKKNIPERRANFRARHNCDTAKDKLTPRYWSCKQW